MRKAIKSSNAGFGQGNAGAGKMFRRVVAGHIRTRPAIGVGSGCRVAVGALACR
jgi:hypothetical protein